MDEPQIQDWLAIAQSWKRVMGYILPLEGGSLQKEPTLLPPLASRTVRGHTSTPFVVVWCGSPGNLTQVSHPAPLTPDYVCGYLF